MLGTALSGLVNKILEKYWSFFHQTYTNDVLRDRDECFKFWGQKVKVQGQVTLLYRWRHTVLDVFSCRVRLSCLFNRPFLLVRPVRLVRLVRPVSRNELP